MAHQMVLVLVDSIDRATEQVEALLAPHSLYAPTSTYKDYFEPCWWDGRMWEADDAGAFVRRRSELLGETYERDEAGFFQWRTDNPDGHYDFFTIGGRWSGEFREVCPPSEFGLPDDDGLAGNICPILRLPADQDAGSIVTPDGEWHFFGWRFGGEDLDPEARALVQRVREQWVNCLAVVVDCHS